MPLFVTAVNCPSTLTVQASVPAWQTIACLRSVYYVDTRNMQGHQEDSIKCLEQELKSAGEEVRKFKEVKAAATS